MRLIPSSSYLLLLLWVVASPLQAAQFVGVEDGKLESDEGKALLEWRSEATAGTPEFELQQLAGPGRLEPRILYTGPDTATFLSGLGEGTYQFRVRELEGEWSEPVELKVRYPSPYLVWSLMGLGTFVFLATLVAILRGHRRQTVEGASG